MRGAHVGVLPAARIASLSKLARAVESFAARMQVQEVCRSNIELRVLSCGYAAWRYSLIMPATTGFGGWIAGR
ncbi:GTP cyclohydrolase I [Nonomuraea jabiensis]|uniref:GTP cyclohydrolase I n=1 Tax=Nonomuraea jabiensis TaxID=882448 RepID=UPI003D71C5DD